MMEYEKLAKIKYQEGDNCSSAIYNIFKEKYNLKISCPKPRSVDGLCGTVIVAHEILRELNKEKCIEEFNKIFLDRYHSLKCIDLIKDKKMCHEYVGFSAKLLGELIGK